MYTENITDMGIEFYCPSLELFDDLPVQVLDISTGILEKFSRKDVVTWGYFNSFLYGSLGDTNYCDLICFVHGDELFEYVSMIVDENVDCYGSDVFVEVVEC